MKKEGLKNISKPVKPRIKTRKRLSEIQFNILDPPVPQRKLQRMSHSHSFSSLPEPVQICILGFLSASDLLLSVQLVSRGMKSLIETPVLWQWLEKSGHLSLRYRLRDCKSIVERRSKGKVFSGVLRSSLSSVLIRMVSLDVSNAGFDDGVPTSLLRDISYMSELSHENIVRLVNVELSGKHLYMMHEYIEFNLKDFLKQFELGESYKMPRELIQSILRQILEGLNYLHHKRFMHRNLKPDNLLITPNGKLKIADFTLAKLASFPHTIYTPEDPKERDRSGREARRLWYRAPEFLLRKEMYGFEVDMWTVGCLLGEIALGQPLFNGDNEIEQLFKIFRFTGIPPEVYPEQARTFPSWEPFNFCDIVADTHSKDYQELLKKLVPSRKVVFDTLKILAERIGPEGLDLLQKLLDVDTDRRITAVQALEHPFISAGSSFSCQISGYLDQFHAWERTNLCLEDYFSKQTSLTASMRSILIDWIIDVSVHFEVCDNTLHITIGLIDRVLEKMPVDRTKLQLVGVTCMKIADVLNEKSKEYYRQENSIEYAYITADEYSPAEVVQMEKDILNALNFKVLTPTILTFMGPYQYALNIDEETGHIAGYLADLALLSCDTLKFKPSLLASAILYLACCSTNRFPDMSTNKVQPMYPRTEFNQAVSHVKQLWLDARTNPVVSRYESINHKYHDIDPRNLWPPSANTHQWVYTDM